MQGSYAGDQPGRRLQQGSGGGAPADKEDDDDTARYDAQLILAFITVFMYAHVRSKHTKGTSYDEKTWFKAFVICVLNLIAAWIQYRVSNHLSIFAVMYILNAWYIAYIFWKDYTQYNSIDGTTKVNITRQIMYCVVGFGVLLFGILYFIIRHTVWLWLATGFTGVGLMMTAWMLKKLRIMKVNAASNVTASNAQFFW